MKIAVLGAGIAGLTAAHHLAHHPAGRAEVVVFEARDRVGGNIRTTDLDGCRVEWGPNGFLDNEPATLELVAELGLEARLLPAGQSASERFVWRAGRLRALPATPQGFLTSSCLPFAARLRALAEPSFGFLVPHGQGLGILSALYDSSIFAGRAPADRHLVRVLIGGRRKAAAVDLDDQHLLDLALRDLGRAWGPLPPPRAHGIARHPLGIAQYERGHARLLREIETHCPPHLRLAGSSYRGVALNACIKEARSWSP